AGLCSGLQERADPVDLLLRHQWSEIGVGIDAGADLELLGMPGDALDQLLEDVLVGVEPRAGGADLAAVEEDAVGGGGNGALEVGVGEDDDRRLAAELQRHPLEVAG